MARIRSIHPGIFTDEAFVTVSPLARVLLFGIWTEADDHGAFDWKPLTFKMRLLPADNVDVAALMEELLGADTVKKVDIEGKATGLIRNFCRFQSPKHPSYRVTIPPEYRNYIGLNADGSVPNRQSSPTPHPALPDKEPTAPETLPQRERRGGKRNGRGEEPKPESISKTVVVVSDAKHDDTTTQVQDGLAGKEESAPIPFNPLGTSLPADWVPNDADLATAISYGMTYEYQQRELEMFHAINKENGTFSKDWSGTWTKFCIRFKERQETKPKRAPARVEVTMPLTHGEKDWDWQAKHFSTGGVWSHQFGPQPGSPGCKCPPEILTKYGIDPVTGIVSAKEKVS